MKAARENIIENYYDLFFLPAVLLCSPQYSSLRGTRRACLLVRVRTLRTYIKRIKLQIQRYIICKYLQQDGK